MNIGIDVDGVLTNIQDYIFEYGSKYAYEKGANFLECRKYEYETAKMFEWSKKADEEFWQFILEDYSENEPPRKFAKEVIDKLKEAGHNIYIITARHSITNEDILSQRMERLLVEWLDKHEIPYDFVIFEQDKTKPIKALDIDIMIEDSPENIRELSKYCEVIVFDAVYNKDVSNVRVNSWYEILYYIENVVENREKGKDRDSGMDLD